MIRVVVSILLCGAVSFAAPVRPVVTLIHPDRDGYASARESVSHFKELWVQGAGDIVSWVAFNLRGYTFKHTKTIMLAIHIVSVKRAGICDIHPLIAPPLTAERRITRKSLRYDDIPLVTVMLDSSHSNQMLFLNITDPAKSKSFHGIVLRSRGTLDASFGAKEGNVSPAILCTHSPTTETSVSWFSGPDKPDPQTGKTGDFLVRTTTATLYHKFKNGWDSVSVLRAPKNNAHQGARTSTKRRPQSRK